jgi:GNAT superfamily N-acetyltransferase
MKTHIVHVTPVAKTARVMQMASLFDLPLEDKTTLRIDASLPIEDKPWSVGLIVGPSGCGKTSIARKLFPGAIVGEQKWSEGALIDDFPADLPVRDVVGLLTAVGLGSPPAWIRPWSTLSNGEAFRASIARALADSQGLVVVDEFTSVVDRQVAKVASHTVQKTVRRTGRQFIAVSCHYDIAEWLQPDWTYDVAAAEFRWGSVQPRPQLQLRVHEVDRAAWSMFARHHYLSGELSTSAKCFGGWIGDVLVAFTSYRHFPHAYTRNIKLGHRLVVLPDYQGLGIGGRMDDWLGQHLYERGYRYRNVVAHPAMIRYYSASPRWQDTTAGKRRLITTTKDAGLRRMQLDPRRLSTRSFEYRPPRGA